MSEAPERIWLQSAEDAKHQCEGRMWCADKVWPENADQREPTEYLRADIAERQIAELRAEVAEHKRLKNQLVLKAYPAMDAIDEIAEGFRSAVHFVRNNAMNIERDYPEICHAEEVFSRVRAALAGKE